MSSTKKIAPKEFLTLELSASQYKALMTVARLGQWMANGIRTEGERSKEIESLLEHLRAFGEKHELHYEDEERIEEYKKEYDEEMFVAELVERLTDRDLKELMGDAYDASLSHYSMLQRRSDIITRYLVEFDKNGVKNVKVAES